jgi:hypothetical protein
MKKLFVLAAALAAGMALTACGGGGGETVTVAATDAVATITASNGQQATTPILSKDFSFPSGVPALSATGPTVLTFKPRTTSTLPDNRAPAGNPEFTLTSSEGTVAGLVAFGSCKFIVTFSTNAKVTVGTEIVINPCTITYDTDNKPTGTVVQTTATITLGTTPSVGVAVPVTIDATGNVTVNGLSTGANSPVVTISGG